MKSFELNQLIELSNNIFNSKPTWHRIPGGGYYGIRKGMPNHCCYNCKRVKLIGDTWNLRTRCKLHKKFVDNFYSCESWVQSLHKRY